MLYKRFLTLIFLSSIWASNPPIVSSIEFKGHKITQDYIIEREILHQLDIPLDSALANQEQYFGYIGKDATIIGETSGAVATVTSVDLNSDNWGDLLGAFFFRNANISP